MDSSFRTSIEEIKKNIDKLQKSSGVKLIFFTVLTVTLITLIVIYFILKLKRKDKYDSLYDDYDEDGTEVYPFDEEDFEEEIEETTEE